MGVVGHPDVTARAYAQDPETIKAAVRFAEACVENGLHRYALAPADALRLKAQIERDYLVSLLPAEVA